MKKKLYFPATALRNLAALSLFVAFLIILQLDNHLLLIVWAIAAGLSFFEKTIRYFVLTLMAFGIGFFVYSYITTHWLINISQDETRVLLNRLSLIVVLVPLIFFSLIFRLRFMYYWQKPQWEEPVHNPFIWAGFRKTKVSTFLVMAMMINFLVFLPFILNHSFSFFQGIWGFMIIFSILNGTLEEMIWRGFLLSRFSENFGNRWAVVLTSVGFGLQHYSLGFSWVSCLAFSMGGFFFGAITVQSKSIVPAVIWHMFFNALMVLSGMIVS
ncbi:CPBP family intramembrane glutamic endopeptidase [Aquibacillus albus]|uniref:Membrane protease YdiL (CAAX protease family) n=1 Tax=Aquibacillus albus TaxID=1168171 RepID=A0ABS2N2I8_9BACI|nr:type II CAAX endopeptidase family protein [Aquibacillus albus]MBM7572345.1 membrane protease YdiL (CAAX protease family) [Aquibacillus albus]